MKVFNVTSNNFWVKLYRKAAISITFLILLFSMSFISQHQITFLLQRFCDFFVTPAYAASKGAEPVAHEPRVGAPFRVREGGDATRTLKGAATFGRVDSERVDRGGSKTKVGASFSLRESGDAMRNLKVAATEWLLPLAYAASKGADPVVSMRHCEEAAEGSRRSNHSLFIEGCNEIFSFDSGLSANSSEGRGFNPGMIWNGHRSDTSIRIFPAQGYMLSGADNFKSQFPERMNNLFSFGINREFRQWRATSASAINASWGKSAFLMTLGPKVLMWKRMADFVSARASSYVLPSPTTTPSKPKGYPTYPSSSLEITILNFFDRCIFTPPYVNSITPTQRCQGEIRHKPAVGASVAAMAYSLRTLKGAATFEGVDRGSITKVGASFSLRRAMRNLKVAATEWLLPSAYAASKGADPVAHWRFDEGGGPTAHDESSNNNDGTLTPGAGGTNTAAGQMWTRQGKVGSAGEFDGTDDYVSVGNTPGTLTEGTIEIWFNRSASKSGYQMLFTDSGSQFEVCYNTDTLQFYIDNSAITTTSANNNGVWQHVVGTFSQTGNYRRLYLNGVLVASGAYTGDATVAARYIGSRAGSYPFEGLIDDVKIYDYARSAEQVLVDYNAGSAVHLGAGTDANEGNPPVAYWTLDENTGTTAYDRSGNNNNGTITGATWAQGKNGPALSFDGNDYMISGTSLLNNQTAQTISAWIYINSLPTSTDLWRLPTIVSKGDVYINFGYDENGKLFGYYYNSSSTPVTTIKSSSSMATGSWYHVAWTWTSSSTKLYINGREEYSGTDIGPGYNLHSSHVNGDVRTGLSPSVGSQGANGKIDDVKIYDYARTQGQIAYGYNRGAPIAHYKFDEPGGVIAHNEASSADTGTAPAAWWRMDNDWTDASGNGKNGTANNQAAFNTSSKIGPYCGTFDGTGDYVDVAGTVGGYSSALTVEGWINHTTTSDWDDILAGGCGDILFGFNSDVLSFGGQCNSPFTPVVYSTNINGAWHHVAGVYNGSTAKLYVDGVEVTSASRSGSFTPGSLDIGGSGVGESFNGKIDDLRVYNYARTQEQIYNDYKTTHATLVSGAKFSDGKIGKGLLLNGSTDYAECGDVLNPGSSAFTVETWFKLTSAGGLSSSILYNKEDLYEASAGGGYFTYAWQPHWAWDGGTSFPVNVGEWYQAAVVYDKSNQYVYKNGVLVYSRAQTGDMGTNTNTLRIGARGSPAAAGSFFPGVIDDTRFYNYARTQEQILQDYNAGASSRLGAQSTGVADPWGGALPVAHWKLDENTGVRANDASGNGYNGTLGGGTAANMPSWTQGKNGPALSFDGANDYVTASLSLGTGSAMTVEAWAYPTDITSNTYYEIMRQDSNAWIFSFQDNGTILSFGLDAGGTYDELDVSITASNYTNGWHHLAAVYNGSTKKIYRDGVEIGSGSKTGNFSISGSHHIGSYNEGEYFNGKIDDVKIYNYARSAGQIAYDYNAGKPVGHWRFDEATSGAVPTTSGTIKDDSDNDNDGTASNTTWTYTTGKFGGALNFDGNDYVTKASPVGMNFSKSNAMTLEGWFKLTSHVDFDGIVSVVSSGEYARVLVDPGLGPYYDIFGADQDVAGYTFALNTWYHYVLTVEGGGSAKVYVNGAQVSSSTAGVPATLQDITTVYIGAGEGPTSHLTQGLIDDVRIYNYARTAEQILQDYLNGASARLGD